jgi:hypothetical protein
MSVIEIESFIKKVKFRYQGIAHFPRYQFVCISFLWATPILLILNIDINFFSAFRTSDKVTINLILIIRAIKSLFI